MEVPKRVWNLGLPPGLEFVYASRGARIGICQSFGSDLQHRINSDRAREPKPLKKRNPQAPTLGTAATAHQFTDSLSLIHANGNASRRPARGHNAGVVLQAAVVAVRRVRGAEKRRLSAGRHLEGQSRPALHAIDATTYYFVRRPSTRRGRTRRTARRRSRP